MCSNNELCLCWFNNLLGFSERFAGKFGIGAQFFFDAENLIVFSQTFRAARSASLNLTSRQTNDQISDEGILSFAGTMRYHGAPAVLFGQQMGLDGFGNGTNLVDLQQQTVAGLLFNGSLDTFGIGDSQIITNDLNAGSGSKFSPGIPMILIEGIFNGYNGEVLDEFLVQIGQFFWGQPLGFVAVGVLEIQIVGTILEEFRCGNIHADFNLAGVTAQSDGIDDKTQGFLVGLNVGCKTTFITDSGSIQTEFILDDLFQVMVDFRANFHGFGEAGGTGRQNHEFLHSQFVASVAATVDDIESRYRQNDILVTSQVSNMFVQWYTLLGSTSFTYGQRNTQDSVGTEFALVLSTVQFQHEVIDGFLIGNF
ncbi:hypothetical protein DOY81_005060 [Sarcophaga bullata]|nr:hypothetical protein DOY81_005060 [Sarcophaga bullata]